MSDLEEQLIRIFAVVATVADGSAGTVSNGCPTVCDHVYKAVVPPPPDPAAAPPPPPPLLPQATIPSARMAERVVKIK
jgi:hypothetical protein